MVKVDNNQTSELVASLNAEAHDHSQRWQKWLGVASAGGILTILSLSANLPNPEFALNQFEWSLSFFGVSLLMAGLAAPLAEKRANALSSHFAASANREEWKNAIEATPLVISSPKSPAVEMNAERCKLVQEHDREHEVSEKSWELNQRWKIAHRTTLIFGMLFFTFGLFTPIFMLHFDVALIP